MSLRLIFTDGDNVQAMVATFGSYINTAIPQTAADAAAAAASAAAALDSENAAATSASASSASASASAASASSSATSAGNSAASATASANSAIAAAGSATAAAGSATTATTQAGIATTQAGNSASSATAAGTSATNAAASAAAAAATLSSSLLKANNLSDVSNATTARANILAAKSGANSDITSLTALTTPIPISEGGTGSTTASAALAALGGVPLVSQCKPYARVSLQNSSPSFTANATTLFGSWDTVEFDVTPSGVAASWNAGGQRFNPKVAGLYRVVVAMVFSAFPNGVAAQNITANVTLLKNSANVKSNIQQQTVNFAAGLNFNPALSCMVTMNGTTDFLQVSVLMSVGASQSSPPLVNLGNGTYFEIEYLGAS